MNIFDLHCDTLKKLVNSNESNLKDNQFMVSINKMKESNYLGQCFACFVNIKNEDPVVEVLKMIDKFYVEVNKYEDIDVVFSYEDILRNKEKNVISAMLTIEEGAALKGSLELLRIYYKLGVRMITLTWNYENEIGYPASNFSSTIGEDNGLTEFGIKLIEMMNELGMIIDVSHLSDKGFYDVINYSKKPIVASHSNSRYIKNHPRNITDDMIRKLHKNRGIIGINYYNSFVSDEGYTYVKDIVKHIKHIKDVASIDVIALGSDFDGIDDKLELKDASTLTLLKEELIRQNFSQGEIDKIFYKNVLRVFKESL